MCSRVSSSSWVAPRIARTATPASSVATALSDRPAGQPGRPRTSSEPGGVQQGAELVAGQLAQLARTAARAARPGRSRCGSAGAPGGRPRRAAGARSGCGPRGWPARRSSGPAVRRDAPWHARTSTGPSSRVTPASSRRTVALLTGPRPRRRRSCRSSYDGCATRWAKSPSLVSRISPSVSVSSRPTWKSRSGRSATRSAEGAPALRVGHRGDHAAGLVEHQVDVRAHRRQPLAVDPDHRRARVDLGAEPGDHLAVDLDQPGEHQLLALAPAGHARLGEQLLQPDQPVVVSSGRSAHRRARRRSAPSSRSAGRGRRGRPCRAGSGASSGRSASEVTPIRSRK